MPDFSPNQTAFLGAFSQASGINPGVAAAWMAAEEPVGASASVGHNSQNWLNIGNTDTATLGSGTNAWSNPVAAGRLSAQWLKGQASVPGFGHAAPGIVAITRVPANNPMGQIAALQHSGWASSGYPDLPGLYNTYKNTSVPSIPAIAAAPGIRPGASAPGARPVTQTIRGTTGGGLDQAAVAEAVLAKEAARPIGAGLSKSNPLADYASAAASGLYNTPIQHTTKTITTPAQAPAPANGSLRGGTLHPMSGHAGNVNPLGAGWTIGRTDMGVDANAAPGTPIKAINDSKVVGMQSNWYAGQPLIMMQLTAGPDRGKYWYVAEQIDHALHVGQTVAAGQTVATYAHAGTGIEIGWGGNPNGTTLAQAQGNTGDASHGNSPAGLNFAKTILGR